MKDYYQILGVKKNATFYDITEAYRELSVTYHPDNHANNEEYKEKYNDIQEAYNTLSNGIKRREYDSYVTHINKTEKEKKATAQPVIEYFRTDKETFDYGEEVVFSWKTLDANKITLVPFGEVQPMGTFNHTLKNFKNKLLTFELIAENTENGKEVKASVSLNNKHFEEIYSHFKKEFEARYPPVQEKPIEIEKEHLPFIPGNKEIEKKKEFFSNTERRKEKLKVAQVVPEKPKKQEMKGTESSENNILLFIVILFLTIGFSILIYIGFFM